MVISKMWEIAAMLIIGKFGAKRILLSILRKVLRLINRRKKQIVNFFLVKGMCERFYQKSIYEGLKVPVICLKR